MVFAYPGWLQSQGRAISNYFFFTRSPEKSSRQPQCCPGKLNTFISQNLFSTLLFVLCDFVRGRELASDWKETASDILWSFLLSWRVLVIYTTAWVYIRITRQVHPIFIQRPTEHHNLFKSTKDLGAQFLESALPLHSRDDLYMLPHTAYVSLNPSIYIYIYTITRRDA